MSHWAWFFTLELADDAAPFFTTDDALIDRAMDPAREPKLHLASLYSYQLTQLESEVMGRDVPDPPLPSAPNPDPDASEPYLVAPLEQDFVQWLAAANGREKRWMSRLTVVPREVVELLSELCAAALANRERACVLFVPELIRARPSGLPRARTAYCYTPAGGYLVRRATE